MIEVNCAKSLMELKYERYMQTAPDPALPALCQNRPATTFDTPE